MEEMLAVILEAVRQAGRRALLLSGWGGVPVPAAGVFAIGSVPHDWLLPRCCLVVHHGGAGTTAAALRSGTPSMVIPLAGDQPFWARRVDALGVGPRSIRARDLSVEAMRSALQAIGSAEHAARAAALARLLQAEDGVGAGVRLVEAQRRAWERAGTPQP
jgi:UDP:flavonoid glycosyltransferase YjiC (YdhE family)